MEFKEKLIAFISKEVKRKSNLSEIFEKREE